MPRPIEERLPWDRPGKTLEKLYELMRSEDAPGDAEISRRFGCSKNYVYMLRVGKIPNPSVNRVEALLDYLQSKS